MELLEKLETLNNHLIAKNYKKVIDGCNKILKKNPNIPYVLNLCGLALQGTNNILASMNCSRDGYFNFNERVSKRNKFKMWKVKI